MSRFVSAPTAPKPIKMVRHESIPPRARSNSTSGRSCITPSQERWAAVGMALLWADGGRHGGGLAGQNEGACSQLLWVLGDTWEVPATRLDTDLAKDRMGTAFDFRGHVGIRERLEARRIVGVDHAYQARTV